MARLSFVLATACLTAGLACEDPSGVVRTADGFEYRAWLDILESFPIQLHVHVEVRNRTTRTIVAEFPDGCVVLARAFLNDAPQPVWDQAGNVGCTDAIVTATLRPGQSTRYESRTGARDILGDSLPDGFYRIEAYLRPRRGPVAVDAGTVPLSVPRNP